MKLIRFASLILPNIPFPHSHAKHSLLKVFLPGIVSRASANGQLFEEDEIEHDSLQTENNNRKVAATGVASGGVTTISTTPANAGSNLLSATDAMGSSENNLTVYF